MKAEDFDKKFDDGEDISEYLDMAQMPNILTQRRHHAKGRHIQCPE